MRSCRRIGTDMSGNNHISFQIISVLLHIQKFCRRRKCSQCPVSVRNKTGYFRAGTESPPKRPRSPIVGASIPLLFPLVPGILIRIISVFPFGACKGYTVTSACGLTDSRYAFTFSSSFSSLFFCYLNFRYFFHLSQYTKNPNSIVTFVLFAQIYLKSYLPAATSQSHYKLNLSFLVLSLRYWLHLQCTG